MVAYVVLIYGILVLVGGVIGYVKVRSMPSITMGAISGAALVVSAILMMKQNSAGWYLAAGLSLFLAVFFGYRFKNTRQFMPAGLMLVLSLISLLVLLLKPML